MKRIIIFSFAIFFTFFSANSFSKTVNEDRAKKVAKFFFQMKFAQYKNIKSTEIRKYKGQSSFYIFNFKTGGWIIVSADDLVCPVLAFSEGENFNIEDCSQPILNLLKQYEKQIELARKGKITTNKIKKTWEKLNNDIATLKSVTMYIPNTHLLDTPDRGNNIWKQSKNNDSGCNPSYNKYCPINTSCTNCDRPPAGCGSVAPGQVMWYWEWPKSSQYRNYAWSKMNNELRNNDPDDIPLLLSDIGTATGMIYWCSGAWCTMNNMVDALQNTFDYESVKKLKKEDWLYGNTWNSIIQSEINAQRPVVYRGGNVVDLNNFPNEIGSVHYFVIDGYKSYDFDYFHINWGWGGSSNGYFYLNNLNPNNTSDGYNKIQMAISGFSPTYSNPPSHKLNLFDLNYVEVNDDHFEDVEQAIEIPANFESLNINYGANYSLIAGERIKLKSGFKLNAGAKFKAKVIPNYIVDMDIHITNWDNFFSPNGDGNQDFLEIEVNGADSWEFEAFDMTGSIVYQSAGNISENIAQVWDGTNTTSNGTYSCNIRLKNSYGRDEENSYIITVGQSNKSINIADEMFVNEETKNIIEGDESLIQIFPNPNSGSFFIKATQKIDQIYIYSSTGAQVMNITNYNLDDQIVLQKNGIYLIRIHQENETTTKKVIINNTL